MISFSLDVSAKLPTYSPPKSTLTLTFHLGQNVGLGEGYVGSFPERYIAVNATERFNEKKVDPFAGQDQQHSRMLWLGSLRCKIPQRRRRQKRHLKSDFAFFETLARLSQLAHFFQCRQTFTELNC